MSRSKASQHQKTNHSLPLAQVNLKGQGSPLMTKNHIPFSLCTSTLRQASCGIEY